MTLVLTQPIKMFGNIGDGERFNTCTYTLDGETFMVSHNSGIAFSDVESCESQAYEKGTPDDDDLAEAQAIDAEVAASIKAGVGEEYPTGTPVEVLNLGAEEVEYLISAEVLADDREG